MAHVVQEVDPQIVVAVDQLRARFGWQLIEREAFIRQAAAHMHTGSFTKASHAAFNLYTLAMHAACSGQEGPERQELAYRELGRYLADIAQGHFHESDPDAVNEALSAIFEHFSSCHTPGAFLAFATQRLRDLLKRRWNKRTVSLDTQITLAGDDAESGLNQALSAELRERLLRCRQLFLARHKGAQLQFLAVWMKYMQQLDDQAIALQLGKAPRQVHLLRCRGLKKLRNEPAWQELAAELGFPHA